MSPVQSLYRGLVCRDVATMGQRLKGLWNGSERWVLGVDVTKEYWSFAISDRSWTRAYPFGVVARVNDGVDREAGLLRRGLDIAGMSHAVAALVVGWRPGIDEDAVEGLVNAMGRSGYDESLAAVVFFDEQVVLRRALHDLDDFTRVSVELGTSCTSSLTVPLQNQ